MAASRRTLTRPDLSRMEAWTLRKALLVVALVFASFAGGAVVNGPGLSWLKGIIGDRLHRGDAIPTLDVDDGPPLAVADAEPNPPPDTPVAEKLASPAAEDAPPAPVAAKPETAPPSDAPAPAEPSPLPLPELPASAPTPKAPAPDPSKLIDKTPAPNPAAGFEDAPGPAPSTAVLPRSRPARDRAPMADSAVAAATGTPAEPPPLSSSTPATMSAGSPNPGDWEALRKRMKALGVTRYWVEGTPSGAVTFRCVVPSGGPDAANRQFEAEAADERQAADSALRRVAVWKAAERIKK
jgi:hypothetical protein